MNGLASELDQPPSDAPDVSANIAAAVARAAGRGEIGPHPVPAHILDVPHALLRHELAIRHHRPADAELAQIIDDITIPAIQRASHHPGPSQPGKTEHHSLRATPGELLARSWSSAHRRSGPCQKTRDQRKKCRIPMLVLPAS
jgi:hypothetical protein